MAPVGRPKKKQYKRSTPVIRLQNNVAKLERNAELILNRLSTWLAEGDTALVKAVEHTAELMQAITDLKADVVVLEETGFVPPKRSAAVSFFEGQSVAIAPEHMQKYVQAFERVLRKILTSLMAWWYRRIIKWGRSPCGADIKLRSSCGRVTSSLFDVGDEMGAKRPPQR